MMILGRGAQIVIFLWNIGVAVSQITGIGNEEHTCSGRHFDFNWNYTSGVSILIVEWNVNVSNNIATRDIGGSQPFTPNAGYTTRLTQLSDVGITLSSLSESDYGEYGCTVANLNGKAELCPPLTLFVYDPWSEVLSISKTGGGDSVLLQSSINDDRTSYSWIYKDKEVGSEFKYKATENGNYTLTLGKRGRCLSGSSRESIIVTEILDCSLDIFLYGFLPDFLIVLIVSIVIIIILKIECLPKQFGGLTWKKLGIIAVCFVVAIIIGVCLGLLIKGCDNKFLALALSLLFGSLLVVALILALIYYHKKKFESRRDIQDGGAQDGNGSSQNNTGSNTTRTTTERVGSPASTSNVELAANLKSEY